MLSCALRAGLTTSVAPLPAAIVEDAAPPVLSGLADCTALIFSDKGQWLAATVIERKRPCLSFHVCFLLQALHVRNSLKALRHAHTGAARKRREIYHWGRQSRRALSLFLSYSLLFPLLSLSLSLSASSPLITAIILFEAHAMPMPAYILLLPLPPFPPPPPPPPPQQRASRAAR